MFTFDVIFNFWQWKSIERASNWNGISAHILEYDNIIDIQIR